MSIHVLQHVSFEGPAAIETWAAKHAVPLTKTRLYDNEKLPSHEQYSLLVIMGGPMSVCDEKHYDWITREKLFIEKAIAKGKKVLGICLGAQMIASVMGAFVGQNDHKEIGWFPIFPVKTAAKKGDTVKLPDLFTVLHWHGETFDIPAGCRHVARSAACENQCFTYDNRVIAMQFHLESTPASIRALVSECSHELSEDQHVQTASEIVAASRLCTETNRKLDEILSRLYFGT